MFRSVSSIVIAPANTGRDSNSKKVVTNTDQTKRGSRSKEIPGARIFMIVVINLIEARIDDAPARWREKMARSTDPPACAMFLERGG